jgi:lysophospholipase L1-like esterase
MQPNYREVIPDYPTGGDLIFETNHLGFRGPDFEPEKAAGTYRIVVLGGSAVVTGRTNDDMFTALLEQSLADEFEGTSFEVINAGVPGYTSTQEMFLIETQVLSWEPDLVLVYDGRNDMFEASMPDYTPYLTQRNREVALSQRGSDTPLRQHLFTWDLIARYVLRADQQEHPEQDYATPRGAHHAYHAHPEGLDVYQSNLETIAIVLQGYGVQPAMAFQPTLITTAKPLTEAEVGLLDELDSRFVAAQQELLPEAALRMGAVAEAHDVPWVDLSGVFDEQTDRMFLDDVHQTDAGNALIAQALLEMLEPFVRAGLSD